MSDRIGPMAWGSQGAVFLGDDLMHSRDYSDETARVIDEEVERILRDEEDRCRKTLIEYRRRARRGRPGAPRARDARRRAKSPTSSTTAMGHKVGGPRKIIHADGTEEYAIRTDRGRDSKISAKPREFGELGPEVGGGEGARERRVPRLPRRRRSSPARLRSGSADGGRDRSGTPPRRPRRRQRRAAPSCRTAPRHDSHVRDDAQHDEPRCRGLREVGAVDL